MSWLQTTEKAILQKEKKLEESQLADASDEVLYKIDVPANRYRDDIPLTLSVPDSQPRSGKVWRHKEWCRPFKIFLWGSPNKQDLVCQIW